MCPPVLSNSVLTHFCNSVRSLYLQNQGNVAECPIFFVDVGEEMVLQSYGILALCIQHYKTIHTVIF